MHIRLREGEKLIQKKFANHFKGFEAVGGMLYLTDQRIISSGHNLNFQNHERTINYEDISAIGIN